MTRSGDAGRDTLAEPSSPLHLRDMGTCRGDAFLLVLPTGLARFQ
jgi:hypothetical protein